MERRIHVIRNHAAAVAMLMLAACGESPPDAVDAAPAAAEAAAGPVAETAGAPQTEASWQARAAMPTARQEVYVTTWDDRIYVAGAAECGSNDS